MARVIAIDGPSGAGKSSVSRMVGKRLGFLHVDSGALYRIVTWRCLTENVDLESPEAISSESANVEITFASEDGRIAYRVNGEDPGDRIRTEEVSAASAKVARVKEVRDKVTAILRKTADFGDIIVEGRDITTAVFPDTPARFYLTASAEARSRRRQKQNEAIGLAGTSAEDVKAALEMRDRIDSTRKYAPLKKADGVIEIDSSDLTIDETIEAVIAALPNDWKQ